jgi:hypothetical protein
MQNLNSIVTKTTIKQERDCVKFYLKRNVQINIKWFPFVLLGSKIYNMRNKSNYTYSSSVKQYN